MAELLKNRFNEILISNLADEIRAVYPKFAVNKFKTQVLDESWQDKELKQRMRHISLVLTQFLPDDYRDALDVLSQVAHRFDDLQALLFPDFIELNGLHDYDASVPAMAYFTQFSSSEFPIRFFIKKYPEKMMAQMLVWAEDNNHHLRRLASEGCRPRLPWAIALPDFQKDPTPVLAILEKLKNDESDYVRRSVANNLNDISKDNPQVVLKIAKRWKGKTENTDKLLKHGLRSLLKAGDAEAMHLFGYKPINDLKIDQFKCSPTVLWGEELEFSFRLKSKTSLGKIRVEYAMGFLRANGKHSQKVFKLAEGDFNESSRQWQKLYSFKPITTRKYYAGRQILKIIVNGHVIAEKTFELLAP